MAPWADAEIIPFPALATRAGLTRDVRRELVDSGVIKPLTERGHGKTALITKDDALMFAAAVLLAVAAGVAVVYVLRMLTANSAEVGISGVNIPMPGP